MVRAAPDHAKRDLKKQLDSNDIRKSIVDFIMNHIESSATPERPAASALPPRPATSHAISRPIIPSSSTVESLETAEYVAPPPKKIEKIWMNSTRELDNTIEDMKAFFEGKESEQNWMNREKSMIKLRNIALGNAPKDFPDRFIAAIRVILDGILKASNSLRTTLSTCGCEALQEIANASGPGIDPMVDILLQNYIKICGNTKKLAAQNGSNTVEAIVANATPNHKLVQHMWFACQDKNVQPRLYAAGWLKVMMTKHAHHRHQLEHANGMETLEKCIKKGLSDANPGVREKMRSTFWTFAKVWPERSGAIMDTLDPKSRALLEKDPGNPNASAASTAAGPERPKFSKSTTLPPKPSIKDFKAAQRRAQLAAAAKNPPSRPGSAQDFSASTPAPSSTHRPAAQPASSFRSTAQMGTLSSAPMRPPMRPPRRPEMPRPATAEPFSSAAKARSTASRMAGQKTNGASPKTASRDSPSGSPSKRDEDLTMIFPGLQSAQNRIRGSPPKQSTPRQENNTPTRFGSSLPKVSTPNSTRSARGSQSPPRLVASPRVTREQSPTLTRSRNHAKTDSGDFRSSRLGSRSPDKQAVARRMSIPDTDEPAEVEPVAVYEDPTTIPVSTEASQEFSPAPGSVAENVDPDSGEKAKPKTTQRDGSSPMAPLDNNHNQIAIPNDLKDALDNVGRDNRPGTSHQLWDKRINKVMENDTAPIAKDTKEATYRVSKGIEAIKAGKLDEYGCRIVQSLIQSHAEVFADQEIYNTMMMTLLEELDKPLKLQEDNTPGKREVEYKTQILVTIHLMMKTSKDYFAPHHPQALKAFLLAIKSFKPQAHIIGGLVQSCEAVILECHTTTALLSILDVLDMDNDNTQERNTLRETCLYSLTMALARYNTLPADAKMPIDDETSDRLGKLADLCWRDPRPAVRNRDLEYALQLRDALGGGDEKLEGYIGADKETFRAFFKYQDAKKKRGEKA